MKEVTFDRSPQIKINGIVCDLNIDSASQFQRFSDIAAKFNAAHTDIQEGCDRTREIIEIVQELVSTILGDGVYESVFDSAEAKDNWRWHIKVFFAISSEVYSARVRLVEEIANDSLVQEMKAANRAQRRATVTKVK